MTQRKISEWLNALPEPYRSEALKEFKKQGWLDLIVRNAEDAIGYAFDWAVTPQKYSYWSNVCEWIDGGEIQPSKFPAPVNTWIPVDELGNYAEIEEHPKYSNIIGWLGEDWNVVNYDDEKKIYCNQFIDELPSHIMIINPPNQ